MTKKTVRSKTPRAKARTLPRVAKAKTTAAKTTKSTPSAARIEAKTPAESTAAKEQIFHGTLPELEELVDTIRAERDVAARAADPENVERKAAWQRLEDTQRLLARPGEGMELGEEDRYELSDVLYTGFANELGFEAGLLRNLSMMAHGLVLAALHPDSYNQDELVHYVYCVARDIRDRARAGGCVLGYQRDGAHWEAVKARDAEKHSGNVAVEGRAS